MIKQISLKNPKNIVGTFKAKLYENLKNKKTYNELYDMYVMNAIKEAEENIANGGKTYTLEEYQERMKKLYGAKI